MANIKIKDKNGNWITIASGNANGIATSNSDESVEDVLTEHSNKIAKLERNVSWLALHGGGGAGGGGGSSFISSLATFEGLDSSVTSKVSTSNPSTTGGSLIITYIGS